MLLLFVQDDDAKVAAGGEHCRAGAHDDLCLAGADPLPLVIPFPQTQAAVEHGYRIAEPGGHQPQKLGGQGDLRHQKQGGFALFQAFLDQADVDGGFAGAGDAVEQRHPRGLGIHLVGKTLKALFLLPVQHQGALNLSGLNFPAAQHRPFRKADIAQLFQPLQGGQGGSRVIAHILHRGAAQGAKQLQGASLQCGSFGPVGGEGHGLFHRGGQGNHFFGFVIDPTPELLLSGDPLFLEEIGNCLLKYRAGSHGIFQRIFLRRTAQLRQPP